MPYRQAVPVGYASLSPSADIRDQNPTPRRAPDLDRPLPTPPATSLPNSYDIPSLRQKHSERSPDSAHSSHHRSFSHPFPAVFGGRRAQRKDEGKTGINDVDSSDDTASPRGKTSKAKKTQTGPSSTTVNKQPITGKCMTCDSTVRWPQDLKTFRCTTCWTINDLEPVDATHPKPDSSKRTIPIRPNHVSIDSTRRLIEQCLGDYFQSLLNRDTHQSINGEKEPSVLSDDDDSQRLDHSARSRTPSDATLSPPRPRFQERSPSDSALMFRHTPSQVNRPLALQIPQRPTRQPPEPPEHDSLRQMRRPSLVAEQTAKHDVFRAVENYIAGALTGCTTLNMSFFSVRPGPYTEEKQRSPGNPRPNQLDSLGTPASEPEAYLSELDAKTLLLGDVVENGLWWTGNHMKQEETIPENARERSPERQKGAVSAKTPRINWLELAEWYQMIIHAGDDWRRRWLSLEQSITGVQQEMWKTVSLDELQTAIFASQSHLQRTLLKATENLLKRPRRPLKNAEDCRFLLILCANPLLLPSPSKTQPRPIAGTNKHSRTGSNPSGSHTRNGAAPKLGALGHHSGIIKRILGLLANLSNDIHLYLVSWFSRFADGHFAKLVEMVGSFVTYRLTRQFSKPVQEAIDPTQGLIPSFSDDSARHASQLHAALDTRQGSSKSKKQDNKPKLSSYSEDWQIRAAARIMALLFQANTGHNARKRDNPVTQEQRMRSAGLNAKHNAYVHGQLIPISSFYNSMLDHADLVADFEAWEATKTKFTFCQYSFFLSIWAKIHILEHDARRQMEAKAREAFFDTILSRKAVSQYLVLKVRRDCLVDDSLKSVSEVIGRGGGDIKKGLKIDFAGEEGVDAGGLRKEWFLLLVREIFDPQHGLFVYDEDSRYCYFNPHCFESSEQFFLVGVLVGLAIYNSTILDVAFPPFVFRKLLASVPPNADKLTATPRFVHHFNLEDLAELQPSLARGLKHLLDFDGDVEQVFCRNFVVDVERYGEILQVPLCPGGSKRSVTNTNRREFVNLYVHYVLDTAVARQYEPFKRGFFTVCGGNALSLFRPEEIELLVRGSDEPLDVNSLRAVASYDGWPKDASPEDQPQVQWFWDFFQHAAPNDQRKILSFITGSDRIPAMGATNLVIRVHKLLDKDAEDHGIPSERFPIARTCFNQLGLYHYKDRLTLEHKLWSAITMSEGFGLK